MAKIVQYNLEHVTAAESKTPADFAQDWAAIKSIVGESHAKSAMRVPAAAWQAPWEGLSFTVLFQVAV